MMNIKGMIIGWGLFVALAVVVVTALNGMGIVLPEYGTFALGALFGYIGIQIGYEYL